MPNINVIRPADGNETVAAWKMALQSKDQPTAIVLTRQNVPTLKNTKELAWEGVQKEHMSYRPLPIKTEVRCWPPVRSVSGC